MESSTKPEKTYQQRSLLQQGYDYDPDELNKLALGLRFTPFICMFMAMVGLYLEQPLIHFTLAALGIIPFWFPNGHPVDLVYNHFVRRMWNGVALPPNPLPRRIACLAGGSMNLAIGIFFSTGMRAWAFAFGAVLIILQLIVTFTHFCLASWFYEIGMKWLGLWSEPISQEEFHNAMASNAILIDVREPREFAKAHLENAQNIPPEQLPDALQDKTKTYVIYCQAGVRSHQVTQKLKNLGFESVLNLGAMERGRAWQKKSYSNQ